MKRKKIGFIGYKGHASRLMDVFERINGCRVECVYHPEKDIDVDALALRDKTSIKVTKNLADLYSCDGVVIASPNASHFDYLKECAANFHGYIFCEKPPIVKKAELEKLRRFSFKDKQRIYFNFNLRFGVFSEIFQTLVSTLKLGDPLRVAVVCGHGLGMQPKYQSMWRSKKSRHRMGVIETLGIHYLDLVTYFYGAPKNIFYKSENFSPYGDSRDTCHFSATFKNNCYFTLTASYCLPLINDMMINFTNGMIMANSSEIKVFGPRDVFDRQGFFCSPPLVYARKLQRNFIYQDSLKKSCNYFFDCLRSSRPVSVDHFNQSMKTNELLLNLNSQ